MNDNWKLNERVRRDEKRNSDFFHVPDVIVGQPLTKELTLFNQQSQSIEIYAQHKPMTPEQWMMSLALTFHYYQVSRTDDEVKKQKEIGDWSDTLKSASDLHLSIEQICDTLGLAHGGQQYKDVKRILKELNEPMVLTAKNEHGDYVAISDSLIWFDENKFIETKIKRQKTRYYTIKLTDAFIRQINEKYFSQLPNNTLQLLTKHKFNTKIDTLILSDLFTQYKFPKTDSKYRIMYNDVVESLKKEPSSKTYFRSDNGKPRESRIIEQIKKAMDLAIKVNIISSYEEFTHPYNGRGFEVEFNKGFAPKIKAGTNKKKVHN